MRKTPVKRVNRARRAKNHARSYGGKARIEFVKSLPCCAALCHLLTTRQSENAHIETGGTGRKADADKIVPMCPDHHRDFHQYGREWFEDMCMVDLSRAAAETERLWQEHLARGE